MDFQTCFPMVSTWETRRFHMHPPEKKHQNDFLACKLVETLDFPNVILGEVHGSPRFPKGNMKETT